jgi:hypothetical protein
MGLRNMRFAQLYPRAAAMASGGVIRPRPGAVTSWRRVAGRQRPDARYLSELRRKMRPTWNEVRGIQT